MPLVEWGTKAVQDVSKALAADALVAMPVGALEQHGPHLPTNTDSVLANEVLRAAADHSRSSVIVLPVLAIGISDLHLRFGGTVSITRPTFESVLRDICATVREAGARHFVIVNGHGGNSAALDAVAAAESTDEFMVVSITYWTLVSDTARALFQADQGIIGHGGQIETSLMLCHPPGLVGPLPDRFEDVSVTRTRRREDQLGVTGLIGDPREGRRELGERFLAAVSQELAVILDALPVRARNDHQAGRPQR
jgi:creatinine amidohydrolase